MEIQKHRNLLVLAYAVGVLASLNFSCGSKSCIESEKQALIFFKESLVDHSNYLSSWVGDDCCAWQGIGCNNVTGHVMKLDLGSGNLLGNTILNSSLIDLKYLSYLDLSFNIFDGIQIPEYFGSFKDLTYLDLSYSKFSGLVPQHLGNLSRLQYLDLSLNFLSIDSMGWLSKLSLLEHLDLSDIHLSRATDWSSFMNLTYLVSLDLSRSLFESSFPTWVLNNSGLADLNLESCYLKGSIPEYIGRLTSLTNLNLGSNKFQGLILNSIESLTSLSTLDLSHNEFQGLIPQSIGNLISLSTLDLSHNEFDGLIPQSIGNLTSLSTLDLSSNKLNDSIPHEMGNLTELTDLRIGSNELRGSLPEAFCQLSMLETLQVPDNQLSGSIPECIGELSNLDYLDLESNSWEGFVSEHHFVNLTSLTDLYISSKSNLVLNVSSKWVPPFQLEFIYMESMKVGPKFPRWLLTQTQIRIIRMQNTSIFDVIPVDWFVTVLLSQAFSVDLSNNDINVEQLSFISVAPSYLASLALSSNRFSGEFPAFICNLTNLYTLVLSNNNFSGKLPQCLENLGALRNLDVMNNSLSGDIPVSLGSLRYLTYLNLHNNKFQGKLPLSFQNLTWLVALDVGNNNLRDIIPPWIGEQLHHLKYLVLRSNNFYSNIPKQLCNHSSIQILNLAHNQITGNIPPCFGNFSAMIIGNNSSLDPGFESDDGQTIIDDAKGYEQKYTSTLGFMYSIDLSYNNISGEIPGELMDLHGLLNLNLAGNHLAGRIPGRIGKLEKLEFLDLSRNKLYGPIPQSLSDLNFLSRLNLSFNNLSGRIPTGNQLQILDDPSSIYAGNNELCGQLILKPCAGDPQSHNNVPDHNEDSDSDDYRLWVYAGIGPGMLVGFLAFCGSLHLIKSWRYAYFHFLEQAFDKIVVVIAVKAAQLRRKFHT